MNAMSLKYSLRQFLKKTNIVDSHRYFFLFKKDILSLKNYTLLKKHNFLARKI